MEDKNNTFNSCAHLVEGQDEILQFLETMKDVDTMSMIIDKQLELQKFLEERPDWYLPSFDPSKPKTCGEILRLIQFAKLHFDREYFELEDALGGMSNGAKNASSVAKPWKKDHLQYLNKPYSELSEEDRQEINMEVIDMIHFFAMIILSIGLSGEDIKYYYTQKNIENFDRQKRGY